MGGKSDNPLIAYLDPSYSSNLNSRTTRHADLVPDPRCFGHLKSGSRATIDGYTHFHH